MSRQVIINQVSAQFSRMGVPFQVGQGADLTIYNEFVDAGWSTGEKRIVYEASVYLDEADSTVFMWERTTETGSGFSGGFSGGSFTQSGTTLFRKVKSIQYGPDGKAYEYNLDLGAIPKTVKEAAKQMGWKFKTVLSKSKAQYPAGYPGSPILNQQAAPAQPIQQAGTSGGSFCAGCGRPLSAGALFCATCGLPTAGAPVRPAAPAYQPQSIPAPVQGYAQAAAAAGKPKDAFRTLAMIAMIATAFVVFGIYALLGVSLVGWIIGLPVFFLSAAIQFTVVKKGCVTGFVIWFLTTAILLGIALFTA